MFPSQFYEAWKRIKQQVSGVLTLQKAEPEPVPKKVYEKNLYYVFQDGKTMPVWQEFPEGGRIVAKISFNSNGMCHAVFSTEVENRGLIAHRAMEYIFKNYGHSFLLFEEIETVKKISA